jgi:hypothetical protein
MTRGRKRKHDPSMPKHIDQAALPRGIYWDRSGAGHWYVFEKSGARLPALMRARPNFTRSWKTSGTSTPRA